MDSVAPQEAPPDAALAARLELRGITKSWGDQKVLDGVDLALAPGALTWVGGRNGAGKTTLLRIAAGLILPDAGEVSREGFDPERQRRAYQRGLGFLSAGNGGLWARLTVEENLRFWARMALLPSSQRKPAVEDALQLFELTDLRKRRVERMSMGQRQRVRVAMAFLHRPDVVLLDEPHTSLDPEGLELVEAAIAVLLERGGAVMCCSPTPIEELDFDALFRVSDGGLVPA